MIYTSTRPEPQADDSLVDRALYILCIIVTDVINTGFEERSEPNVHLQQDKGDAGPPGWWSHPDDHPPRGGDQEGQHGRHQRRLPEDGARRDRQVLDYNEM